MNTKVVFSDSFIEFLEGIRKTSPIARLILACLHIQEVFGGHIIDYVLTTKYVNYITVRSNGLISYMPATRTQAFAPDGTWLKEGRQEGKPSKIMMKVFTPHILQFLKASDFETFNHKYKAHNSGGLEFRVLPPEQIASIYDYENQTHDESCSLGVSCMRGNGDMTKFYRRIPNNAVKGILCLFSPSTDERLVGRALLWNLTLENGNKIVFMDRIYTEDETLYEVFVQHATENGWWFKEKYKSRERKTKFVNPLTGYPETVLVRIPFPNLLNDEGPWPYMDTFYGAMLGKEDEEAYLFNHSERLNESGYEDFRFTETSGVRGVWIQHKQEFTMQEDGDRFVIISYGRFEGTIASEYDAIYVERLNGWILRYEAFEVSGHVYHVTEVKQLGDVD